MPDEPKPIVRLVRHDFTSDELDQMRDDLADRCREIVDLESRKKEATAGFSASLKTAQRTAALVANRIHDRYEMREIVCIYQMNSPRPGRKELVALDGGEIIEETAMTAAERQGDLFAGGGRPS